MSIKKNDLMLNSLRMSYTALYNKQHLSTEVLVKFQHIKHLLHSLESRITINPLNDTNHLSPVITLWPEHRLRQSSLHYKNHYFYLS